MEFLIENARQSLDNMKEMAKRLSEIDKKLKEDTLIDTDLYGEQFQLIMDITRQFDVTDSILKALEQDEQTTFIARRMRRQAEALLGEKKEYDINGSN